MISIWFLCWQRLCQTRTLRYEPPVNRVWDALTLRIIRRADGYYVQFSIQLDPRDTVKPLTPSQQATGIDVGLKCFYADSQGHVEPIPQFYRKSEKQLNRANRKKSKKFRKGVPQSRNYNKARGRYQRKHLRVSRQREEFAKGIALRLIQSNDLIAYEDLNVKGMVRNRHLAKSISDVAWALFRRWLEYFGWKYQKVTVAVAPHNTSQNCSNCAQKVVKSLSTRTHICPHCKYTEDRDINAAVNILKKGLSTVGHTGTHTLGERFPLGELEQSCSLMETQWTKNPRPSGRWSVNYSSLRISTARRIANTIINVTIRSTTALAAASGYCKLSNWFLIK